MMDIFGRDGTPMLSSYCQSSTVSAFENAKNIKKLGNVPLLKEKIEAGINKLNRRFDLSLTPYAIINDAVNRTVRDGFNCNDCHMTICSFCRRRESCEFREKLRAYAMVLYDQDKHVIDETNGVIELQMKCNLFDKDSVAIENYIIFELAEREENK